MFVSTMTRVVAQRSQGRNKVVLISLSSIALHLLSHGIGHAAAGARCLQSQTPQELREAGLTDLRTLDVQMDGVGRIRRKSWSGKYREWKSAVYRLVPNLSAETSVGSPGSPRMAAHLLCFAVRFCQCDLRLPERD
jgi:hypothetical protein